MDPNETLAVLRDMTRLVLSGEHSQDIDAEEIAEYFQHLDTWLSKGGFLPADWRKK